MVEKFGNYKQEKNMPNKFRIKNNKTSIGSKLSRTLLLISIPVIILFIFIAVFFSFQRLNNFQETTNNKNLYLRHEFTLDNLNQWAVEGHMILQDIALSENLQNKYDTPIDIDNSSYISEQLLSLANTYSLTNKKYFDQVIVVDKNGQVLASSDENLLFISINREYFFVNYARQGLDGVYFIEDLTSMFPQQSIVQIYPLFTNIGNPNGAVIGIGNISHLSDIINTTEKIFPESDLFIATEDQNYYLYSPTNYSLNIQSLNENQKEYYKSLFSKESENAGIVYSQTTNFNNQDSQTVFTWDKDLNLGIGTSYAPEETTQQYYIYLVIYIFIIILAIVLLVLTVNILINNTVAPISQIINANEHLSSGDWNFKLPSLTNKDFSELTSSYIKLLDRLMRMGFLPNTVELNELTDDSENLNILEELITSSENELFTELNTIEKSVEEFTKRSFVYEKSIENLRNELRIYKEIISEINNNSIFSKINKTIVEDYGIEKFMFYISKNDGRNIELINQSDNFNGDFISSVNIDNVIWTTQNKIARKREIIDSKSNKKYEEFIVPISNQEISYGAFVFYSSKPEMFSDEFMEILIDLGENVGKINKLSGIFDEMKNSILKNPENINEQDFKTQNNTNQVNTQTQEEIRVKYIDLSIDQQKLIDSFIEEFQSINNFDTLLQSIVKKISELPHVSEAVIQRFDIDKNNN